MTYDEALSYIHGVSNFFCKPGLDRIRELCERLGNPQNDLKFIHVTGTNGKGSVCSMLSSILFEAGYRVGMYTSPYVREFNERMRINGINIPNDDLTLLTERVKEFADKMTDRPTEFELITAIALEYFKKEKCDVVVLEVGMGGRLDATNIIGRPLLSIITGISVDHTAFLGSTIEQIASEKAGIIKNGSPSLYGGDSAIAEAIIRSEAEEKQSILYKTDYSALKINKMVLDGTSFSYKDKQNLTIHMLGEYQPRNAAIVLDAIDILIKGGMRICEEDVRCGLEKAFWPARFEIICREPMVIFDGAHNPQGVEAAVKSIKNYFGNQRVIILSGVLRDKDYRTIAESISQVADRVYTITPQNPRALTAEEYADVYGSLGINASACGSIKEALSLGIKEAEKCDTALFCLGSLYTYSEVIESI